MRKPVKCSGCGASQIDEKLVCQFCGKQLSEVPDNVCMKCWTEFKEGEAFCQKCGTKLTYKCPYCQQDHSTSSFYCSKTGKDVREFKLFKAIEDKDGEKAKDLIDEEPKLIHAKDDNGNTPLHAAAFMKDTTIIGLLLDKKAKINARDDEGDTPLHVALANNDFSASKLLIDRGADLSIINNQGMSAIDSIVESGNLELLKVLISKGIDLNKPGGKGTPLYIASSNGHRDIVIFLMKTNPGIPAEELRKCVAIARSNGHVDTAEIISNTHNKVPRRDKVPAALLAIFMGAFGVHKFYLGKWGWGILFLLLALTPFVSVMVLIGWAEGIIYLVLPKDEFDKLYNRNLPLDAPENWSIKGYSPQKVIYSMVIAWMVISMPVFFVRSCTSIGDNSEDSKASVKTASPKKKAMTIQNPVANQFEPYANYLKSKAEKGEYLKPQAGQTFRSVKVYSPDKKKYAYVETSYDSKLITTPRNLPVCWSRVFIGETDTNKEKEILSTEAGTTTASKTNISIFPFDWSEDSRYFVFVGYYGEPISPPLWAYDTEKDKLIKTIIPAETCPEAVGWLDGNMVYSFVGSGKEFYAWDIGKDKTKQLKEDPSSKICRFALIVQGEKEQLTGEKAATAKVTPEPVFPSEQNDPLTAVSYYYEAIGNKDFKKAYAAQSNKSRSKMTFDKWYGTVWANNVVLSLDEKSLKSEEGNIALVDVKITSTDKNASGANETETYLGTITLNKVKGVWWLDKFDLISHTELVAKRLEEEKKEQERVVQRLLSSVDESLDYYQVAKNPDKYSGKVIKWSGEVGSIREEGGEIQMGVFYRGSDDRLNIDQFWVSGSGFHNTDKLVKGANVIITGKIKGEERVQNRFGVESTIPGVEAIRLQWSQ